MVDSGLKILLFLIKPCCVNGFGASWERKIACGKNYSFPSWNAVGTVKISHSEKPSGWWKKILGLIEGQEGEWLRKNLVHRLGNGRDVSFWDGTWCGDISLKERFPRLYHLNSNQLRTVRKTSGWVDGLWVWSVSWIRDLLDHERGREHDFLTFLVNFQPVEDWLTVGVRGELVMEFSRSRRRTLILSIGAAA